MSTKTRKKATCPLERQPRGEAGGGETGDLSFSPGSAGQSAV